MQSIVPPDIDPRDTDAVTAQTTALASRLSGWSPGERPDAGSALIGAFAAMAQQVIARLNQMPDRHFLAYLRMLGLQPRPPRAAEVPLTFVSTPGAKNVVRVPAGTQVRGKHADGSSTTFYTRNALELLPGREPLLWRAITYQPRDANGIDRVAVRTDMASGRINGQYDLFEASEAVEHAVYLAADEVLAIEGSTLRVSIDFSSSEEASAWQALQQSANVVWEYFSGGGSWLRIAAQSLALDGATFRFDFARPVNMAGCALEVAQQATFAYWIRARLRSWPSGAIPDWHGVRLGTTENVELPASAHAQLLFNSMPIDTSKDYYPLGQQPTFNDSCTLVLATLPAASAATLTVQVNVAANDAGLKAWDEPRLAWEFGNGDAWTDARPTFADADSDGQQVAVLKASGAALITLPEGSADLARPALRMRLAAGDYGKGIYVSIPDSATAGDEAAGSGAAVVNDGYRPPILAGIAVSVSYRPCATPVCVTDNGEGRCVEYFTQPVTPFRLRPDVEPAFYLAFGEPLGQASVSIYLQVAPLSGMTRDALRATHENDIGPARVIWEYSAASAAPSGSTLWKTLRVEDGTNAFSQSAFLRFMAPPDHARSAQFDPVPLYWLRARLASGGYVVPPQGGLVLPNSVAASSARTNLGEVLGSSRQVPAQTFKLAQTPVLQSPDLIVGEPTPPSGGDAEALRAEAAPLAVVTGNERSAPDAAREVANATDAGGSWVSWKQVGSFAASRPQDRHYTLDHDSGTLTFGDGENGMVPPAGKNNIVMARYESGGGTAGNLSAGSINQLVNAVPYVAAVENRIAAAGGADGDSDQDVMAWGSSVLRHRGRATAQQDYEDLVRQAFPQIAKVSAITPRFDPTAGPGDVRGAGHVLVTVVPGADGDRPAPSAGLLQQIGDFLRTRMSPTVQLDMSGPDWLVVSVSVTVIARHMDDAGFLKDEVERALRGFLNPLTGGFDRGGWGLGQMVHDSDLIRHLLALPGVDSVEGLRVTRTPAVGAASGDPGGMPEDTADQKLTVILVCSGDHAVVVAPPGDA